MKNKLSLWFRYCLFCSSKTKKHIYKIVQGSYKERIHVYYCKNCNYIFLKSFLNNDKEMFYRRTYLYKFNREKFSKKEFLDDYEDCYRLLLDGCYMYELNKATFDFEFVPLSEIALFKAVKRKNELRIFE